MKIATKCGSSIGVKRISRIVSKKPRKFESLNNLFLNNFSKYNDDIRLYKFNDDWYKETSTEIDKIKYLDFMAENIEPI